MNFKDIMIIRTTEVFQSKNHLTVNKNNYFFVKELTKEVAKESMIETTIKAIIKVEQRVIILPTSESVIKLTIQSTIQPIIKVT